MSLLLDWEDINPNARLAYMATPLSLRAGNGYEGVVKLLLTRKEADLEILDEEGGTLFSHAAETGQEGVIELPVEWGGVSLHSRDDAGRTPLSPGLLRVERGHGITAWTGSVNPNVPDCPGVTLLSLATENYDKLVVGLLPARETTTLSAGG